MNYVTIMCLAIVQFSIGKLAVGFSQPNYNINESSGNLMVTLLLRRGFSTNSITVTVMSSDQSPLSAKGKR